MSDFLGDQQRQKMDADLWITSPHKNFKNWKDVNETKLALAWESHWQNRFCSHCPWWTLPTMCDEQRQKRSRAIMALSFFNSQGLKRLCCINYNDVWIKQDF